MCPSWVEIEMQKQLAKEVAFAKRLLEDINAEQDQTPTEGDVRGSSGEVQDRDTQEGGEEVCQSGQGESAPEKEKGPLGTAG